MEINKKAIIITAAAAVLLLCTACVPNLGGSAGPPLDPLCSTENIAASLTEIHDAAMPGIMDEIEELDARIDKMNQKLNALVDIREVVDEEIGWWDHDLKQEGSPQGQSFWWYVEYSEDDLRYLSNEYYEVVEFKLNWQWDREEEVWEAYSINVVIKDGESSDEFRHTTLDTVLTNMTNSKSSITAERASKSNAKDKADQVLADALSNEAAWEISQVSQNVCRVSGYGWGYGEKLTTGEWYYYPDTGYLEPRDSAGIRLKDIITAAVEEPASEALQPSTPSDELY